MLRICCYAAVRDPSLFDLVEFYRQDIRALRELGHKVEVAWRPRHLLSRYDVYWIWWPTSGAPAVVWARLRRRPAILVASISNRDRSASGLAAKRPWIRAVAGLSVALADVTLAVSNDVARGLSRYRPRRMRVAPHGVDTDFYCPGFEDDVSEPYVVTISHLTLDNVARKRILDVVRTAAELRDRHSPIRVVIVGAYDAGAPDVEAEIRRLRLEDRVILAGQVTADEKRRLLRGAVAYLQPTDYEAFGLAIAEAMACSTPVVTTAVGAVPEVVGDAGTVLPRDCRPADLASAVLEAAAKPPAERAGGRQRVVEQFSYAKRLSLIEETIRSVVTPPENGQRQ
jgi:glycosyltransferase involved in cell wall biosynthesis